MFACRFLRPHPHLVPLTVFALAWTLAALSPVRGADGGVVSPIKIACIGDSITQGSGLSDEVNLSYPGKLGKLIGSNYVVRNYGVSGRTLLKKGDYPYWRELKFRDSTNWGPDVVIIKLGSNDAKSYNWRYGTNFTSDYLELIATYTNLPSHPKMFLCTPCPVIGAGAFDINPGVVATNIAPAVRALCADGGHSLIDIHVLMGGHPEWFPDRIHPNSAGTSAMAAIVCGHLLGITSASSAPPDLVVEGSSVARLHLGWDLSGITCVLQSTPQLKPTNTAWTIVDRPLVNTGSAIVSSNLSPGSLRFYRLVRY